MHSSCHQSLLPCTGERLYSPFIFGFMSLPVCRPWLNSLPFSTRKILFLWWNISPSPLWRFLFLPFFPTGNTFSLILCPGAFFIWISKRHKCAVNASVFPLTSILGTAHVAPGMGNSPWPHQTLESPLPQAMFLRARSVQMPFFHLWVPQYWVPSVGVDGLNRSIDGGKRVTTGWAQAS